MILIAASILVLATACSALTGTPTPRPTYTPYPTYTPVPLPPLGTNSALPTPTTSPEMVIFQRMEDGERFSYETYEVIKQADQALSEGRHQDALEGYLETQRIHGEPSWVIQNWIGISYVALGQLEAAIQHFTNAIEIKDSALNRTNRGGRYMKTGQCPPAIEDAKAALTMEPDAGEGINTDAEANYILAICYAQQEKYLLALQHAEATLETAKENSYTEIKLENMSLIRDSIQAVLDGRTWQSSPWGTSPTGTPPGSRRSSNTQPSRAESPTSGRPSSPRFGDHTRTTHP